MLINRFSLVPTMRGLYLFSFVMMTIKFFATNAMVTETQQGVIRMEETRHQPLFAVLREYPAVFRQIIRTPATLLTGGLLLVLGIGRMINGTFWSILVTEKLDIPAANLAYFSFARAATMLLFYFLVMPKVRDMDERKPMMIGFAGLVLSQILLSQRACAQLSAVADRDDA